MVNPTWPCGTVEGVLVSLITLPSNGQLFIGQYSYGAALFLLIPRRYGGNVTWERSLVPYDGVTLR